MPEPELVVDVHLHPDDLEHALRTDVRTGLAATPKWLPPKWFYDDEGSRLFDEITRLDEYYPTRREAEILAREATAIVSRSGADTVVELGSGTSEKTLLLLDAFHAAGSIKRFIPFDVSEQTLRDAAVRIDQRYPGISVHAVVGDFERHLPTIPVGGNRLVVFLGGTIGNFDRPERAAFLRQLGDLLEPGEHLLVGADLVKEQHRLVAAYDDAQGVTAEFNRNVLRVLNQRLGADFPADEFVHEARWNDREERIEMWLRIDRALEVRIPDPGLTATFEAGEAMRTELSCKFRPEGIAAELAEADLAVVETWTDEAGDFSLTLARRH